MKALFQTLVNKLVPPVPNMVIESQWPKPVAYNYNYKLTPQTRWCEVQTDLDEEIARA